MDLEQILGSSVSLVSELVRDWGRDVLHSIYPKEFELYMISLELVNPNNDIEEYFTFPINPNSMSKIEPYTKTIERGFNRVIVNRNSSFTPQDLSIKGNFGRDFRILVRQKESVTFNSILSKSKFFKEGEFNHSLKSGYGSFKILQRICQRSNELVEGKPMKLYFHNFMLGESYLAEVLDFTAEQSLASNMLWNYSLRLKIIAPINQSKRKVSFKPRSGTVQNTISKTVNRSKQIVSSLR